MSTSPDPRSIPLVRLRRAGEVESVHRGRFVLVVGDAVHAAGGDTRHGVFVRSAAKPIQALVGVTSGAVAQFALDARHVAVATGSHSATPRHVDVVRDTLRRAGLDEAHLQCGGHWSIQGKTARAQRLPAGVDSPPSLWSNCSGKHALMLASARALGAPLDTYLTTEHPVQVRILEALTALGDLSPNEVTWAIDGCGAPAPSLPLETMARTLQRLVVPARRPAAFADAAAQITAAMLEHPELVAGPERFDTDLMQAVPGVVLAKGGAEGVLSVMVPERDMVLVVKVDDGSDRGYRLFAIALLRALGVLDEAAFESLSQRHAPAVLRNHADTVVGSAEALLPPLQG